MQEKKKTTKRILTNHKNHNEQNGGKGTRGSTQKKNWNGEFSKWTVVMKRFAFFFSVRPSKMNQNCKKFEKGIRIDKNDIWSWSCGSDWMQCDEAFRLIKNTLKKYHAIIMMMIIHFGIVELILVRLSLNPFWHGQINGTANQPTSIIKKLIGIEWCVRGTTLYMRNFYPK